MNFRRRHDCDPPLRPHLPPLGIQNLSEALSFPGARVVERYDISPGSDPSVYAYVKSTVHRNLYRIPLQ